MQTAEAIQAELDALAVVMIDKLKLEPAEHWPDFCSDNDEPGARRQHRRLVDRLNKANSGVRAVAPS